MFPIRTAVGWTSAFASIFRALAGKTASIAATSTAGRTHFHMSRLLCTQRISNSVTGNETPKLRGFRSQPPNWTSAESELLTIIDEEADRLNQLAAEVIEMA